jgi:hypothetical protein
MVDVNQKNPGKENYARQQNQNDMGKGKSINEKNVSRKGMDDDEGTKSGC